MVVVLERLVLLVVVLALKARIKLCKRVFAAKLISER